MNKTFAKRFERFKPSSEAKELLAELLTLVIAFLMSGIRFFFDTYPFALAFCAANKKRTPFAVVGAALGIVLFLDASVPYLITLLALIGLRFVGSVWLGDDGERDISLGKKARPKFISLLFSEKVSVRVAISALCTLGLCVSRVILSGYAYYDIFVLIFYTVLSSILTYAFCTLFEEDKSSSFLFGACAMLFVLIYAIRGKEFFGLDISIVLSYGVTLYASKYISGTKSTALGALLGLCHSITFAPVFAICGFISSFLWSFSYYLAIISALVMSVGYGVFASGYEAIVYLLPELLLASLIMYPLTRFEIIPKPKFLCVEERTSATEVICDARTVNLKAMLSRVAASFKDISALLSELSRQAKNPDRDFWRDTCLEICETHCYQCPKRSICWERDVITTKDNLARLGDDAFSEKLLSFDNVDEKFLHRCPNINKIIDEVNALKRDISASRLRYDKLEVSADDYELISRLIEGLCSNIDSEAKANQALSDKATRACKKLGLRCDRIEVFGDRVLRVIGVNIDTESSKCSLDEVRGALDTALGARLTEPIIEEREGEGLLSCRSMRSYDVTSITQSQASNEEEQTGDTLSTFCTPDDKFYMLLCDGMGSGKDASLTSSICSEFMQKILLSCNDKELCLCMLNSFIRAKSLECSSSVDLLEVDLITGESCLVKSGAAPTFVKRGENVFRLHSKTAPIGIMKRLDAERLDFSLRQGDIILMISDGIASDEKDSKYLVDFLSGLEIIDEASETADTTEDTIVTEKLSAANAQPPAQSDPLMSILDEPRATAAKEANRMTLSALPSAILALAKSRGGTIKDDMSVGVVQIRNFAP